MTRPYFEETQMFRENRWIWILVIVSSIVTILPLLDGLYWQVFQGKPWGNKPMTDSGLIGLFLFVLATWAVAMAVLLSMKLDIRIDDRGIHYRFVPIKRKWQKVTKEEVSSYSLERKFRLLKSGGYGYHRNLLTSTLSMRIKGSNHLSLILKDGRKLLLGTQNPEGLQYAMKKLMTHPNEAI